MLKRILFFSSSMYLSLKSKQLICEIRDMPDSMQSIPIEDIGYVIIENQQVKITMPLLNALVDNNVAVMICDDSQMPNALIQPLNANCVQGEMYRLQIDASEPLKKGLWKQCIEAKIKNQALLLQKLGKNDELLKPYYMNVKSGDIDNREGIAAKVYWRELFGKTFVRDRLGKSPNDLLNYGYTILRAAVARSLVGSGLLPAFGIFHRNRYNAFPLADDIMEAYRPYVDEIVYKLYMNSVLELDKKTKSELLKILYMDCKFKKLTRPLDIALTFTTASLAKCFGGKEKKILFPLLE